MGYTPIPQPLGTYSNIKLQGNITMTASTYMGIATYSCGPGTWIVAGSVTFNKTGTGSKSYAARIFDGSTEYARTGVYVESVANAPTSVCVSARITYGITTSVSLQGISDTAATTILSNIITSDQGKNASQMSVFKIGIGT